MATTTARRKTAPAPEQRIPGWVWFAGILLVVAGGFNIIHGFVLLERKSYLSPHLLAHTHLTFWGWAFLIWGALQAFAGIAALMGRLVGNYVGVILAGCSMMLWFFMIFAAPWAAVLGVLANGLVIYALTAGAESEWSR